MSRRLTANADVDPHDLAGRDHSAQYPHSRRVCPGAADSAVSHKAQLVRHSGVVTEAPSAPWRLRGECVIGWVRVPPDLRSLLPAGVRPLPGPAALVAVNYTDSPVGPYLELSLGLPARLGLRPGLCVVLQVVSERDARLGYRRNWGLPASVARLSWWTEGDERVLRCEAPALEIRGVPKGPSFPAVVPVRSIQRRADGPVVLPRRSAALTRLARVVVSGPDVGAGSDLQAGAGTDLAATLGGVHPGLVMAGLRIVAHPARQPIGFLSSLRAPLDVVEPAMAVPAPAPARRATTVASRAGA